MRHSMRHASLTLLRYFHESGKLATVLAILCRSFRGFASRFSGELIALSGNCSGYFRRDDQADMFFVAVNFEKDHISNLSLPVRLKNIGSCSYSELGDKSYV